MKNKMEVKRIEIRTQPKILRAMEWRKETVVPSFIMYIPPICKVVIYILFGFNSNFNIFPTKYTFIDMIYHILTYFRNNTLPWME